MEEADEAVTAEGGTVLDTDGDGSENEGAPNRTTNCPQERTILMKSKQMTKMEMKPTTKPMMRMKIAALDPRALGGTTCA